MLRTALVIAIAIAALPMAAEAQSYRCVGKDGKKYYGQSVPPQCQGLPVEQLNAQGLVVKKFDAQASADERAKKEVEETDRKQREATAKEEGRRNRALLATYTSESDVEASRGRAIAGTQGAVKEIEGKIAGLKKRQADLARELGAMQDKNSPAAARAKEDIKNAEIDLKAQEGLLATKKKEADAINARYDDDRKRYVELTRKEK
jgi:hypothetical protein